MTTKALIFCSIVFTMVRESKTYIKKQISAMKDLTYVFLFRFESCLRHSFTHTRISICMLQVKSVYNTRVLLHVYIFTPEQTYRHFKEEMKRC